MKGERERDRRRRRREKVFEGNHNLNLRPVDRT
jgi:hypothetical protein